jgi:hypothetical protein
VSWDHHTDRQTERERERERIRRLLDLNMCAAVLELDDSGNGNIECNYLVSKVITRAASTT